MNFSEMWKEFVAWIEGIGHDALDFIIEAATAVGKELGKAGMAIVLAQVVQVEKDYAAGDKSQAKKDMAFNKIKPALIEAGINAANSTINFAIEAAVKKMQAAI